MSAKTKLALWEIGCVIWVCVAGSMLHFAFELTDYWTPMVLVAAANESAWEHTKILFWPGFVFAFVQYTYTRHLHRNYWQGKAAALAGTALAILALYYGYMAALDIWGGSANLQAMITITVLGVGIGQFVSYRILTAEPFSPGTGRYAAVTITTLVAMFSLLTFFPPRVFLFENLFCYAYTGEYGILDDYEPYRVFTRGDDPSSANINYCAKADQDSS